MSYLHSQLCQYYSFMNIHSDLSPLAVPKLEIGKIYIFAKICSYDLYYISQSRCHPAPYEDKAVVTINTMIFTRCIGQVAAVSHGRNGSCIMMLAMWPVHGQCGHYPPICVSPGRMRGNNSPVCHRKPLLSPHNPLQQSNTNLSLSIGYHHQDIYQQYCKWMQSQVISISS